MGRSRLMRHICYITGTRADFGLMRRTLEGVHKSLDLRLSIIATGMHLDARYGLTVREIEAAGLPVEARLPMLGRDTPTGYTMALDISRMLAGMTDAFERLKPDLVLLLGDRGEMLAGAIAALHLNIPTTHIHGGERSGTIDESVRHAISKLSHFHFTATPQSQERLVRMGEAPQQVFVTGAPGLDGIVQDAVIPRADLLSGQRFDPTRPVAIFVFHTVVQEANEGGHVAAMLLERLLLQGFQVLALRPNCDAGSAEVCAVLDRYTSHADIRVITHLERPAFLSWLAAADVMVGNSSAGIIEAASFGLSVINVGSRQNLRERNTNVIDIEPRPEMLDEALARVRKEVRQPGPNIYGDGQASKRIVELLRTIPLAPSILAKANAY
jgi:GDP/UDP-N,N'-diacetylbacillosamine 2-epimerase (hydrolysing)